MSHEVEGEMLLIRNMHKYNCAFRIEKQKNKLHFVLLVFATTCQLTLIRMLDC